MFRTSMNVCYTFVHDAWVQTVFFCVCRWFQRAFRVFPLVALQHCIHDMDNITIMMPCQSVSNKSIKACKTQRFPAVVIVFRCAKMQQQACFSQGNFKRKKLEKEIWKINSLLTTNVHFKTALLVPWNWLLPFSTKVIYCFETFQNF